MAQQPPDPSDPDPTSPPPRSLHRQHSIVTEKPPTVDPTQAGGSSAFFDSRFTPGTLLAGRYRIVGRLGRGGMGEVYRADDLKLGQAVALKFLPEHFARDPKWLRRFNDEVRIARDVAHPNVCRTYDIVDADGEHFIAMEFVDGEDLSSLLRRIGRLPQDKAIEIARQLCAGLAAAHDRGVLHRDLKPANVMLDGRGRVRITDFGIAALAEEMHGKDARSGTPAYMAPEQLAGEAASVRSDIYSLGLVLYEIFTGKEAYHADSVSELQKMRQSGTFTTPSSLVRDLDPLVERVIMRCLENDPKQRPSSAIAVAAALPGGDPLAMALAAGETPSPEMVAHAGQSGGLRPALAITLLAATLLFIVIAIVIEQRTSLLAYSPLPKPPEVIRDRAMEVLKSLGYPNEPVDDALWLEHSVDYLDYIKRMEQSPDRWDRLRRDPNVWIFMYRSSPEPLVARGESGTIGWTNPPLSVSGMTRMQFDPRGRLQYLSVVPPATSTVVASPTSAAATAPEEAWADLFAAAGLDRSNLSPTSPARTPPVCCDTRAAWKGAWPGTDIEFSVEAGSFQGRPVYFNIVNPWDVLVVADESARGYALATELLLVIGVVSIAMVMALRNVRSGRSDRHGASRLAVVIAALSLLGWAVSAHHPPSADAGLRLSAAFIRSLGYGLSCWILYVAVEPYARRYWPQSMISWSRLLSGRVRDPLVGRDVLLGCVAGAMVSLTGSCRQFLVSGLFGQPPQQPDAVNPSTLGGWSGLGVLLNSYDSIGVFIGLFVLLLLLRVVLRRQWLAIAVIAVPLTALLSNFFADHPSAWVAPLIIVATLLFVMLRFGLLALLAMSVTGPFLWLLPATFDLSQWWAPAGLWGPIAVAALAGYGFWIALAGQPLFRDEHSLRPLVAR